MVETNMQVGQEITGRITSQITEAEYLLECSSHSDDSSVILRSRSGRLYSIGDEDTFWIFQMDVFTKRVFVSDSNFGRLPVSDRMRPRYRKAITGFLDAIADEEHVSIPDAEDISELKGMFNRCLRKDQWDWFIVFKLFGYPPHRDLREIVALLAELGKLKRSGEIQLAHDCFQRLITTPLKKLVVAARDSLEQDYPRLSFSRLYSAPEAELNTGTEAAEETITDPYILSQISKRKLERANAVHAEILNILAKLLTSSGYVVEHNQLIDLYTRLRTGPAIFEVKSTTPENERTQCRHGLSQLYEYRYLHSLPSATLWLVLSAPLQQKWLIGYLEDDRDVRVVWNENGKLYGKHALLLDITSSNPNTTF